MLDFEPSPSQTLLLWKLAVSGGECWLGDIKPKSLAEKPARAALQRLKLISEESRTRRREGRRATRGKYLTLEEKGWSWLSDHLDAKISRSQAAAEVLQAMLLKIRTHLETNRLVLADLISAEPEIGFGELQATEPVATRSTLVEERRESPDDPQAIQGRISDAYSRLAGYQSNTRVRLSRVRNELADVPREQLDEAMRQLVDSGAVILSRLDNPLEITTEDEDAKIVSSLGDPRHIMHMEIHVHA